MWQGGLPDSRVTVEEVVAEGDRVMQVEVMEGTHTGEILGGIAPTGKRITLRGVWVYFIRDGKIGGYWNLWDWLGLYRHLELVPPTRQLISEHAERGSTQRS